MCHILCGYICWSMFLHKPIANNAEVVYVMYVGWVYICGSMPIRAIAVYVPKEGSGLSLSVRPRKKIDTRNA